MRKVSEIQRSRAPREDQASAEEDQTESKEISMCEEE